MKALMLNEFGGPEVLRYRELPAPVLPSGSVLVRTKAVGMNFADIYRRRGDYHLEGSPPYLLGYEGAGIVEQVSGDVGSIQIGDRIGFADVPFANAELVSVPADRAIPVPPDITLEQAAAVLLQGMTAHYLVNDSYRAAPGDEILIHAAAGGVGQLLIQLGKNKGARVIGLTSSRVKQETALRAGADEVLLYGSNWVEEVTRWSKEGKGVNVVYDSVGSTLPDSFSVTKITGTVVFYGMSGGNPPFIDPRMLMDTSKTLTGGDLWNHVTTREDRIRRSSELFEAMRQGRLFVENPTTFPLMEGAEAHRLMESRTHTGKIILVP
jgi:NADPH2:quinone reductase